MLCLRYLTSRAVLLLLSNSRWRPLPENGRSCFLENEPDKENIHNVPPLEQCVIRSHPQKNAAIYACMKNIVAQFRLGCPTSVTHPELLTYTKMGWMERVC